MSANPFERLYCFSRGEYSDYRESWYTHERTMSEGEVFELLRAIWPAVKQDIERQLAERADEYERLFGVKEDPAGYGRFPYRYENGLRIMKTPCGTPEEADAHFQKWLRLSSGEWDKLLIASGFVEVEIPFKIQTDDYGYTLDGIQKTLDRGPV